MTDENRAPTEPTDEAAEARRAFMKKCGKFAAVTPPAIALLLTATTTPAFASHDAGLGHSTHFNPKTKEPPPTVGNGNQNGGTSGFAGSSSFGGSSGRHGRRNWWNW